MANEYFMMFHTYSSENRKGIFLINTKIGDFVQ